MRYLSVVWTHAYAKTRGGGRRGAWVGTERVCAYQSGEVAACVADEAYEKARDEEEDVEHRHE